MTIVRLIIQIIIIIIITVNLIITQSPEEEQSIVFKTLRPHRFFSEPTLLPKEFLHVVVPASLLL